jgi:predicted CXXCH cytochrome family protein
MPRRSRLALAAVLLALAFARAVETPAILSPPADSAFEKGPLTVIAAAPAGSKLLLDGEPAPAASPAPGVLAATLNPKPGLHEIALETPNGRKAIRIAVGPAPPSGFTAFRPHPATATCENCHAVKDGAWSWKRPSLVSICFDCHNKETFPKSHTHVPGILADCQICHDPHGSTAPAHLVLSKDQACKQCHN